MTDATPDRHAHDGRLGLGLIAFGAAMTAHQLAWTKLGAALLGGSGRSEALVLAVFMAGMAWGALRHGRLVGQRDARRHLARLTVSVAAWTAALPWVVGAVAASPPAPWLRWAAAVALFAPATTWIGGTFPVVAHLATSRDDVQRTVARLAACQSLGAIVGVLAGGLALLPLGGLRLLHGAAVALSLVAAWVLTRAPVGSPAAGEPSEVDDGDDLPAPPFAVLLAALALVGATLLGLEIVVTRFVAIAFGSTASAFALMLAGVLTGLALGSAAVARLRPKRPLATLAACQFAAPLALALSLPLVDRLGYLGGLARLRLLDVGGLPLVHVAEAGLVMLVLLVPTAAIGAALPLAAPLAVRAAGGRVGVAIGAATAASAIGNVVGSLATALWLIPRIGPARALVALIVVHAVAALLLLVRAPRRALATLGAAAVVVLVALTSGLRPAAPTTLELAHDHLRWRSIEDLDLEDGEDVSFDAWRRRYLLTPERYDAFRLAHDEHVTATALRLDALTALDVNGKPDASLALVGSDMVPMLLLGHLPLFAKPDAERALLVGWGGGTTAAAMLRHPLEALTVAEISPAVLDVATLFEPGNGHPRDDERLELVVDDARLVLRERDTRYDVIVAQPSNPWVAGQGALFTREAFEEVAARLVEGGIFAMWVPEYEQDDDSTALIVRTLDAVFPYVEAFRALGTSGETFLIASDRMWTWDFAAIEERFDRAEVSTDLARAGRHSVAALFACHALEPGDFHALVEATPGPLNTDAHERLAHVSPRAFFAGETSTWLAQAAATSDIDLLGSYVAWRAEQGAPVAREEWDDLLDEFGATIDPARRDAWLSARDAAPTRDGRAPRPSRAGRIPIAAAGFDRAVRAGLVAAAEDDLERAVDALARAHALRPAHAFTAQRLAQLHVQRGDPTAARDTLVACLDAGTDAPVAVGLRLAGLLTALGDLDGAARADEAVLAHGEQPEALVRLAEHAARAERWDDAIDLYARSLRARRSNPRAAVGLAQLLWRVRGDADGALDVLDEAEAGTEAGRAALAEARRGILAGSLSAR